MSVARKSRSLASRDKSNLSSSSISSSSKRDPQTPRPKPNDNDLGLQRTLDSIFNQPRSPKRQRTEADTGLNYQIFGKLQAATNGRLSVITDRSHQKRIPNPLRPLTEGKGLRMEDAISIDGSDEDEEQTPRVRPAPVMPKPSHPRRDSTSKPLVSDSLPPRRSKQPSPAKSVSSATSSSSLIIIAERQGKRTGGAFGSHAKVKIAEPNSPVKGRSPARISRSDPRLRRYSSKTPSFNSVQSPIKSLPASQKEPTASPRKPHIDSSLKGSPTSTVSSLKPNISAYKGYVPLPTRTTNPNRTPRQRSVYDESFQDTTRRRAPSPYPSQPDRPKRSRPTEGAYLIPSMEAAYWPSTPSTMSQAHSWRRKPKEERPKASTDTGSSPRQELPPVELGSPVTSPETTMKVFRTEIVPLAPESQSEAGDDQAVAEDGGVKELREAEEGVQVEEDGPADLLAKYADFEFLASSPEPEVDHEADQVPAEGQAFPAEDQEVVEKVKSEATMDMIPSVDRPPEPTFNPSSRHGPQPSGSHLSPSKTTEPAPVDVAALARAEAEANRAEARRRAEERQAERDRQLQELLEQEIKPEAEEHESPEADIDDIFSALEEAPVSVEEPIIELVQPKGRTTAEERTHITSVPTPLNAILRATRKEHRHGLDNSYYSRLLTKIRTSTAPDEVYPSPESLADPEDVSMTEHEIRKLANDLPADSMDEDMIQELVGNEVEVEIWTSFWNSATQDKQYPLPWIERPLRLEGVVGVKGKLLQSAIDRKDFASILIMVTLPGYLPTLHLRSNINESNAFQLCQWILKHIMYDREDPVLLSDVLCAMLALDCPHPFGSSRKMFNDLIDLYLDVGMRDCILDDPHHHHDRYFSAMTREAICEFGCSIVETAALNGRLEDLDANELAQILVVLAADTSTSPTIRCSVERVLSALFAGLTRSPLAIAKELLRRAQRIQAPLFGHTRMLLSIGRRTRQQQAIMRWYAIGALLGDDLKDVPKDASVPDINRLEEGIHKIYNELCEPQPDHRKIAYWLVLFTESCSDINALFTSVGERTEEFEMLQKIILASMNKIKVQPFSKHKDHLNKARLGQLQVNLEQVFKSAASLKKKKDMENMKGLESGSGGQMRLSLSVATERLVADKKSKKTGDSGGSKARIGNQVGPRQKTDTQGWNSDGGESSRVHRKDRQ